VRAPYNRRSVALHLLDNVFSDTTAMSGVRRTAVSQRHPRMSGVDSPAPESSQRRHWLVGKAGLEPAASASRTLRATKLRHFPEAPAYFS
jgi:hypothetical protein